MKDTWRLIHSGHLPAATNMAIDEAIQEAVGAGDAPATLRFYGWEPPAVSVGYFQDMESEIDLAVCRSLGIDCVRRPTGGRAVLHDVEVTYSVALPEGKPGVPAGIVESYRVLSGGLVAGLSALGVKAELVPAAERPELDSAACFDAPSWYEVAVDGKKVVGSAQTRRHGALLQHGSILLELDVDKLFALLVCPNEAQRDRARQRFVQKATSLRTALGRSVSFMEVSHAVAEGFAKTFNVRLVAGELTAKERERAEQLRAVKYGTDAWNRGRQEARLA